MSFINIQFDFTSSSTVFEEQIDICQCINLKKLTIIWEVLTFKQDAVKQMLNYLRQCCTNRFAIFVIFCIVDTIDDGYTK